MSDLLPILLIALSWGTGGLIVRLMLPGRSDARVAIQVGYGFFVGIGLTVVLVAMLRVLGLGLWWQPVVTALVLISLTSLVAGRILVGSAGPAIGLRAWAGDTARWQVWLLVALVVWLFVRVVLVGVEAGLRPLYAWDGWMHWSPKARVWLETGQWLEFASRAAWFDDPSRSVYTIRNWSYPDFVPLLQTWVIMPLGRWDAVAFGYPWVALFLALIFAVYGTARFAGCSPLLAALSAWLLVSLPFIHVHAALPGYADIWLGAYVGLAAGSLILAEARQQGRWVALSVLFGLVCAWIKVPGVAWLVVLLGGVVAYTLPVRQLALMLVAAMVCLALVVLVGIDLHLPGGGRFAISSSGFDLPIIGQYDWQFNPVFTTIIKQLMLGSSWHFFWPLCVILYMSSLPGAIRSPAARSAWLLAVFGSCFLLVAFLLTSRGAAIETTQITHRAFIPLAILVVMTLPVLISATISAGAEPLRFRQNEPQS